MNYRFEDEMKPNERCCECTADEFRSHAAKLAKLESQSAVHLGQQAALPSAHIRAVSTMVSTYANHVLHS